MEVHHHPDLNHKKKHLKEYLLEFLMIFLAVTLGFLAENVREHITSRSKEKEYIRGFIRNVQDDTANLRRIINLDIDQVKGIDSFLSLWHANMKLDSNRKFFYYTLHNFYNSASFSGNNSTLQQLKSTGDYRLIVRDHVADSLSKYDTDIQGLSMQANYYYMYFKEILSMLDVLTDQSIYEDTTYMKNGKFTSKPIPELNTDNNQLHILFNKAHDFRLITYSYANNMLKPALVNATHLISFLRKEYDIGDE